MKYFILSALLFSVLPTAFSQAAKTGHFSNIELQNAPNGSTIVFYGPIHAENVISDIQKAGSWQKFLEAHGITFPKGGYAIFDPSTQSLIAATTPDQQKQLYILLSP